jgi:hypothetical protein
LVGARQMLTLRQWRRSDSRRGVGLQSHAWHGGRSAHVDEWRCRAVLECEVVNRRVRAQGGHGEDHDGQCPREREGDTLHHRQRVEWYVSCVHSCD